MQATPLQTPACIATRPATPLSPPTRQEGSSSTSLSFTSFSTASSTTGSSSTREAGTRSPRHSRCLCARSTDRTSPSASDRRPRLRLSSSRWLVRSTSKASTRCRSPSRITSCELSVFPLLWKSCTEADFAALCSAIWVTRRCSRAIPQSVPPPKELNSLLSPSADNVPTRTT